MSFTVGEVAGLSHLSVRTLHHYDEIGLLVPSGRTPSGYRLYDEADLERLRQILFYRELEFSLDEIAAMLADPGCTAADDLRRQHRLLREQIDRRHDLLRAIAGARPAPIASRNGARRRTPRTAGCG